MAGNTRQFSPVAQRNAPGNALGKARQLHTHIVCLVRPCGQQALAHLGRARSSLGAAVAEGAKGQADESVLKCEGKSRISRS